MKFTTLIALIGTTAAVRLTRGDASGAMSTGSGPMGGKPKKNGEPRGTKSNEDSSDGEDSDGEGSDDDHHLPPHIHEAIREHGNHAVAVFDALIEDMPATGEVLIDDAIGMVGEDFGDDQERLEFLKMGLGEVDSNDDGAISVEELEDARDFIRGHQAHGHAEEVLETLHALDLQDGAAVADATNAAFNYVAENFAPEQASDEEMMAWEAHITDLIHFVAGHVDENEDGLISHDEVAGAIEHFAEVLEMRPDELEEANEAIEDAASQGGSQGGPKKGGSSGGPSGGPSGGSSGGPPKKGGSAAQ